MEILFSHWQQANTCSSHCIDFWKTDAIKSDLSPWCLSTASSFPASTKRRRYCRKACILASWSRMLGCQSPTPAKPKVYKLQVWGWSSCRGLTWQHCFAGTKTCFAHSNLLPEFLASSCCSTNAHALTNCWGYFELISPLYVGFEYAAVQSAVASSLGRTRFGDSHALPSNFLDDNDPICLARP